MDGATASSLGGELYDRDFYAWTLRQAAALRSRGAGGNTLDYDNLAEEVEDLGKSQHRACRSLLLRVLEHLLKLRTRPDSDAVAHWRGELREFRDQLGQQLTASIANDLRPQLPELHARAVENLRVRGLLSDDEARSLGQEGRPSWRQTLDEDWYPAALDA